ncbi:MAG: TonB-dependent receptor [Saprospiraceae bacterium]
MKKAAILMGCILYWIPFTFAKNTYPPLKTTLSGKIINKTTDESLPGVYVYLPELKTGAISNEEGYYQIENLPQTSVLVQVSFTGYKLIAVMIDLDSVSTMDFAMEESINELHEIVITGLSGPTEKNRTPTPISTIPSIEFLHHSSTNIVDALAKQPGISQVTTGVGISKPVIRGLAYNRVVVVNDGIRQEGQQCGDEHGIEIDEFTVHKIEILKVPASLAYGSDALAGVINFISSPTSPDGKIGGNILANYQTNNGLIAYSANLAGNRNGFIWDLRYSNKKAHAYRNKFDGFVLNSGFSENSISGIVGLNKSWGYSHFHFSAYHIIPGIIEGDRDSATGFFIKPMALNDTTEISIIGTNADFRSYSRSIPYQKINHYKAVFNNSFILGEGSLKTVIGWQQNQRQEFGDIFSPNEYGLYFLLNTLTYDVKYIFANQHQLEISAGVNGMAQASKNQGTEFLIPDYHLFDIGAFLVAQKTIDQLDITAGLRFDIRDQQGDELYLNAEGEKVNSSDPEALLRFDSFNSLFKGFSGSIGATYQFSEFIYAKLNLAKGFRSPNIAEISANGVHEGTINYIIGDPALQAESSLQLDFAMGLNSEHITAEVDLFTSNIDDFIFLRKLNSAHGGDSLSGGYSTFKYSAGDAKLSGGELSIDIHPHPLDWLHFKNSFSYVLAQQQRQPDSTRYLPFMPAPRIDSELKAEIKKIGRLIKNGYLKLEMENYLHQDKFYSAFGTETRTPAYTLVNFGFGGDVTNKGKTLFSLFCQANNITDTAYQSHLSRLKYAGYNNATGRGGVYNMGRNFSIKLIVPFDL